MKRSRNKNRGKQRPQNTAGQAKKQNQDRKQNRTSKSKQVFPHEARAREPPKSTFHPTMNYITRDQIKNEQDAIKKFNEENQPVCALCGKVIEDISSAVQGKGSSDDLIHFDCAVEEIKKQENLSEGDRIAYIGQGRFGVIHQPKESNTKNFVIKKVIEWEEKGTKSKIQGEMAILYSTIK